VIQVDRLGYTLLLYAQVLRRNLLICHYSSAWYPIIASHYSALHATSKDEIPRNIDATLNMPTAFLVLPLCVDGEVAVMPEPVGVTIV
jgi:hypothetical protein